MEIAQPPLSPSVAPFGRGMNGVKSLSFTNIFHAPAKIHPQRISTESVPGLEI
jgi:hypothetical protein